MTHRLFTFEEARTSAPDHSLAVLADWMARSPMSGHADLGRSGAVCPFLKQASRLETLRIGVSELRPQDEDEVFAMMRGSFAELERMPAPRGKERLRTIVYGFPNCATEHGLAMLRRIDKRHKYYTLARFRMMAFFHPNSDAGGLWNPDFRPMRAPMPVLGIRYLTEQDSIFAAKHHLMLAPYLLRFGPVGAQRVLAHWRGKGADASTNA
ncbi:MAG TPA: hypothetical protein VG942_16070 [Hyphomonadaceae bacterium]|nr:hypothetical protein [Hyphomonadaceae bacterium]